MRLLLLIFFFGFSCFSFGQDSLTIDTTIKTFNPIVQDTIAEDSAPSASSGYAQKNKKPGKKLKRYKVKEKPLVIKEDNTKAVDAIENIKGLVITGILIFAGIAVLVFLRSSSGPTDKHDTSSPGNDDIISDYLSRMLLSRRDYYNNVYLKSEAWKRKRYVVMRRDNWRCVYCGGQATQVHHTRYAKWNIGKEPIEWLVSVCKTCHESKH